MIGHSEIAFRLLGPVEGGVIGVAAAIRTKARDREAVETV